MNNLFQCSQCNKLYKHQRSLRRHIKEKHEGKSRNKAYHCLICDKYFLDDYHFQRHKCVIIHKKLIKFFS